MILALHLDNLLFLLFVAVAILFQLLTRAATKSGRQTGSDPNRRATSSPPLRREKTETEEDRIRKFLEALGQPTTSKPPPPVAPRPTYQKPVVLPHVPPPIRSPLPPLTTRPPESEPDWRLPSKAQLPTQPTPPSEPVIEARVTAALEPTTPPISKQTEANLDIATLLRSASGLRRAILLREIFGPPRSLQPLDLVGTV